MMLAYNLFLLFKIDMVKTAEYRQQIKTSHLCRQIGVYNDCNVDSRTDILDWLAAYSRYRRGIF
jgi:hypothetical protein